MYPFLCYVSPLKTATDEDVGLERGDSCKEVGVRRPHHVPPLTSAEVSTPPCGLLLY
jgi:hypothetical protein